MKVYFNRQLRRSPWGGGAHFHSAMVDHLISRGHTVVERLEDGIDILFMLDPRHEDGGCGVDRLEKYCRSHPATKVLHRVNECDARKNGDGSFDVFLLASMDFAHRVVFISGWLKDYFVARGFTRFDSPVIYNGCNTEWFYPAKYERDLTKHKIKLVTHHWSDNRMKGFDVYDGFDHFIERNPHFEFTYIGRYSPTSPPLKRIRIIPPLYGKALGDELRRHDIYVTASRFEPCGMHHIEGAACGLPVLYHEDGGGIVEGCEKHGEAFSSKIGSFERALDKVVRNYDGYVGRIDHEFLSMKRCCEEYEKILHEMIQ